MKFKYLDIKTISWNEDKNILLKNDRGLWFEMAEELISKNEILDVIDHSNDKYLHQKIFILKIKGYLCKVPFVEINNEIFLKTIYPDRRLKKLYK